MLQSSKVKIQWGYESDVEEDFFGHCLSFQKSKALRDDDAMFEILITDFICVLSDSNTELNKVKFT